MVRSNKLCIDDMQPLAANRGGKCLSTEYINNQSKLVWECSLGHVFEASANMVQQGHWCAVCAKNKKSTITDMRELAALKNGRCLSDKYVNVKTPLSWRCADGHIWKAKPKTIRQGTWCPICAGSFGEAICRDVFEAIFGVPFEKCRPKWLGNPEFFKAAGT